jgi:hypothetical protein
MKHELSYGLKSVTLNESLIRSFRQATTSISADEFSRQLVQGLHPAGRRPDAPHSSHCAVAQACCCCLASSLSPAQKVIATALVDGRCAHINIGGARTRAEECGHREEAQFGLRSLRTESIAAMSEEGFA